MSSWDGLEEIVAIADAGSFVGGAKLLGVSPSHVSRAVVRLEARLQAQLFLRTTRTVSLTDTGRMLVEQSRRIIDERNEALAMVSGSGEPQGELRITCSTTFGERFVAPIVRRYAEAHPKLVIQLELSNRLIDLVGEGYDLGVRTGRPPIDARLTARRIAARPVLVCASPAYLERAGTPQSIEDLVRHECLVGSSPTWHFEQAGQPVVHTPRGRWRCNSGTAIVEAAKAGMGLCQVPAFYAMPDIKAGALCTVLDSLIGPDEMIWAVYPHRRHLLPKVHHLVKRLEAELGDAIARA
jgi:DNA-binding transcriptional LysR family regulator